MRAQITVDCADPHSLAAFYAAGLGYDVEDHEPIIKQLVAQGLFPEDGAVEVGGRLAFPDAAGCRDPAGTMPRLHFQKVPESRSEKKNRLHLDFLCGDEPSRDATVERTLSLGARRLGEGRQGPVNAWVIMADPEGNEFCGGSG
ncbi:MAG: VOC family protein [Acidimicrobiia bacterium]